MAVTAQAAGEEKLPDGSYVALHHHLSPRTASRLQSLYSLSVPFLDCHIMATMQYVALSDWLLSLGSGY